MNTLAKRKEVKGVKDHWKDISEMRIHTKDTGNIQWKHITGTKGTTQKKVEKDQSKGADHLCELTVKAMISTVRIIDM